MKFSEMNAHQKEATKIVRDQYNDYIGGLENTLLDYPEDDEHYITAKATLADHDSLKDIIYGFVVNEAKRRHYSKHINFAGKAFIMERIENRLKKDNL